MVEKKKPNKDASVELGPSSDPSDSIAIELRQAREAKGLSFSDLHRQTGISRTTLHNYESGRSTPGGREIRLLCNALRITPNHLFYGAEEPFQEKSRMHSLLGVTNEDLRTARLAMLLLMLSKNERDAWITILGESIKSRTGGGEKFDLVLDAIEAVSDAIASDVANVVGAALPDQMIAEIGQHIEGKVEAQTKARKARTPK